MEIDKLTFILVKDKKVLFTVSKGKDAFYIPGGKREQGESDKEALIREVKEELSIDLIPETVRYYGTFKAQAHGKPDGTIVKMSCYTGDFRGKIGVSREIDRMLWLDSSNIKDVPPVDKLILTDLKKKNLID